MAWLYRNHLSGTVTDAPLSSGATSVNSAGFANLPTIASPDAMRIVLDPLGAAGAPEIIKVTAHTASATTCTVVRAQEGTTARSHVATTAWAHVATQADLEMLPQAHTVAASTTEGRLTVRTDLDRVLIGNGSAAVPILGYSSTGRIGGEWKRNTTQAFSASGSPAAISFDYEYSDSDTFLTHHATTGTTATIPTAMDGRYAITAAVEVPDSGIDIRPVRLQIVAGALTMPLGLDYTVSGTIIVPLAATNTIQVLVDDPTNGAAFNVTFAYLFIDRYGA